MHVVISRQAEVKLRPLPQFQVVMAYSSNTTATRCVAGRLDRQLVVPASKILDEGMPGDDDSGAAVLLEASHRAQPRLQSAVVTCEPQHPPVDADVVNFDAAGAVAFAERVIAI